MSKLKEILALVRSINGDEFHEQITDGDSLDDVYRELLFLSQKIESKKNRTDVIIDHISNCFAGDFFHQLPISEAQDELDVFCMGFNTYIEELKAVMVSRNLLEIINKKLVEEKEHSKQLVREKDEFMSNMSHEIRTPLNGILGFTNLLLKNTSLDPEAKKQLDSIKISGDILLVIINDILDLLKIESGQIKLSEKPFDLRQVTHFIYNTFSIQITEKEIDFNISIDKNVPMSLIGDSIRISQILFNLVSNAIKFNHSKGKVGLKIQVDKIENGYHFIQISVKDTGIGIPSDKINFIFNPFIQVSNDTGRKYGGTGLGLAVIKKIINIMNGEIYVKSKLGLGSKFTTTIPFQEYTSDSSVSQLIINNDQSTISVSDGKIKVLVAEDNRINQLLVRTVLKRFNFDCTIVDNGKLAVEALIKESFDIILMDLMMPEMNGYEATLAIRSLDDVAKKNIPIIALTAVVTSPVIEACTSIGIDKYMSKPFEANELHKMIIELLETGRT
jgi:two-component system CheB/CheR fusion protein